MKQIIFYLSIVSYFIFWDFILRILILLPGKIGRRIMNKQDSVIGGTLFVLAKTYMGMAFKKEDINESILPDHFLIISNHQSFIDIALIYAAFPSINPRFVAKKSLGKWFPLVSPLLRFQKHALINRKGDFSAAMAHLEKLAKRASSGYCPVIFPEGTRSKNGALGPFHSGAVRRILSVNPMPVLAIALEGGYKLSSMKKMLMSGINDTIRVKQLDLYPPPKTKKEIQELLSHCRERIDNQLRGWRNQSSD